MAFLTMSMAEIFHSFNMRSQRHSIFTMGTINWALWISLGLALLMTTVVCEIPALAAAFSFTTVTAREYAVAVGLGALVIPIVEIVKAIQRGRAKN
jgi:Ca2+-transporting ATPase